jgi:raffinose/stachyose/melibiose transport system substrate-binding protein
MMYPGGFTTTFATQLLNLRDVAPDAVAQLPQQALNFGCVNFVCANNQPEYLAPADFGGIGFAYNVSMFQKVGVQVPFASWDDLVAAGQKLKAAGYVPFEMGDLEGYQSDFWLAAMQTSFAVPADLDALHQGTLQLTDPKFVQPLTIWAQLYAAGLINQDACSLAEPAGEQVFLAGKAAMVATFSPASFYKAMSGNVGVMYLPPINNSTTAGVAKETGEGWVITKLAKNVPLAVAFLTFITNAAEQTGYYNAGGILPANPAADISKAPDPLTAALSALGAGPNFKLLALDSVLPIQTQTEYFKQTALALCGKETPLAAMQAVQTVYDKERTPQP